MDYFRVLTAGGAVLLMMLAGCGSEDAEPPPAVHTAANGEVYNDADVEFATAMIPHHGETVQLVVLADDRPLSRGARRLADDIRESRVADVEQMTDWLMAWDVEVPETVVDHANAGHGDDHLTGSETVDELTGLGDAEFEDRWLEVLADHHEEAGELARAEQQDGRYADAVALADAIEQQQSDDIDTMADLLDR